MKTYNVHEAKTNLSKILNEVREGEIVYIAKAGKRIAELRPINEKKRSIKLGLFKNKLWAADDWDSDEVNEEIAKTFYQEELTNPNSNEEVDGEVHPKYRELFDGKK